MELVPLTPPLSPWGEGADRPRCTLCPTSILGGLRLRLSRLQETSRGEETTCPIQHKIARVHATPLRVVSDFSWLGVSRQNAASACFVEVETDTGLKGHGITQHSDSVAVAVQVNNVGPKLAGSTRSPTNASGTCCTGRFPAARRCNMRAGRSRRSTPRSGTSRAKRWHAGLEAARRRARQGAGLRHDRRAGRRHRTIVRSRAAAGGDGLQMPEDAGRPSRPRQPARPEADDRDRAQRRAPHQGAA